MFMHHYLTSLPYTCRLKEAQQRAPEEFKAFYECMDYYRYAPILCQQNASLENPHNLLNLVHNHCGSTAVSVVMNGLYLQQQI